MRLEFLKVEVEESRRHGARLAALDPHKHEAWWWRGLLEDFWDHGLKASGDKRPDGIVARGPRGPEILAALIGYPGPPDELMGLLTEAQLLDTRKDRLRVKGVEERYGPAWDEQQKRKDKASKAAQARWNDAPSIHQASAEHRPKNAKKKNETEKKTETETEKKDQKHVRDDPQRAYSDQEQCWLSMATERAMRCEQLGLHPGPVPKPPRMINARINEAVAALGFVDESMPDGVLTRWAQLEHLFRRYLRDERFGRFDQHGKVRPDPFPISVFLAPGTLGRLKRDDELEVAA